MLNKAICFALDTINKIRIENEEEEISAFKTFYQLLFQHLNMSSSESLCQKLSEDLVQSNDKYTFYNEVFTIIPELYKDYTLGIISNGWPSLRRVYKYNNLYHYFSIFIISSEIDLYKPNEHIFKHALNICNCEPSEVLFIDDNLENIKSALGIGIRSLQLNRKSKITSDYEIRSLRDVFKHLPH